MREQELLDLQAYLKTFAKNKLIELGYTGQEFHIEELKDKNGESNGKLTLSIGLNDNIYKVFNADIVKFETLDFSPKSFYRIYMGEKLIKMGSNKREYVITNKSSRWARINTESLEEIKTITEEAFLNALKIYKPSLIFSCCSKYNECSKKEECIHEFKLYAKGCQYRDNLEKGDIFYK